MEGGSSSSSGLSVPDVDSIIAYSQSCVPPDVISALRLNPRLGFIIMISPTIEIGFAVPFLSAI